MKLIDLNLDVPNYRPMTAWLRHGPFSMWLIRTMRPRRIVELGTHYGFSYFSFCQAAAVSEVSADCFAVDTWAGDEHAGYYDESVYSKVVEENRKYASFSTLLRKTFAQALEDIEDKSVDILHIDGRHFYEDVKEDFISWVPKLSDRAVVLLHDTEVRERDFGVWRFWAEIASEHPSINFPYEHGLGVLFWGKHIPDALAPFLSLIAAENSRELIENYFYMAGEAFSRKKYSDEQLDIWKDSLASERQATEECRRQISSLIDDMHTTQNQLEVVKNQLMAARKTPLVGLGHYLTYFFMSKISGATSRKLPNFSKRAARSAAKRDPNRDIFL